MGKHRPTVGLFITCHDARNPPSTLAETKLLDCAGCEVVIPAARSCCDQLTLSFGDRHEAKSIARQVIVAFANVDYIVIPSVFCLKTLKRHYPELFADEPKMADAVKSMVARTWEYTPFLEVMCWPDKDGRRLFPLVVEGCRGLDEPPPWS